MFTAKLALVHRKRARSPPLPQSAAPYTSSDMFKTSSSSSQHLSMSWNHQLSKRAARTNVSALKGAASTQPADIITLGTGRPSAEFHPWVSLSTTSTPSIHQEAQETQVDSSYPVSIALNYGFSAGSPHLLRFITEHVELIHSPRYADWACALTCGSTSALDIVFQLLCDPGDAVLVEKYTYTGTIQAAKSLGLRMIGIETDGEGLMPGDLDEKVEGWDEKKGKKPSVLYVVPTGQNPTGTTQGKERREEIYAVAEKYDLIVVEDDPYYFLQLECEDVGDGGNKDGVDRYVESLPVSYLSFDKSGRVIRLDSFSKILAPGLRCGWITAPSQIIEKLLAVTEVSTVAASGVTQVMLYRLLDETWGHLGFVRWLMNLSARYRQRRDILITACQEHLVGMNCTWVIPQNGIFLWIEIRSEEDSRQSCGLSEEERDLTNRSLEDKIFDEAKSFGVLVSKGSWFSCPDTCLQEVCVRLTFAAAAQDSLSEAVHRFSKALRVVLGCP